jgi:uncharacterized protein YcnI
MLVVVLVASLVPAIAAAHISITSGPGFASTSQQVTFGVGHGCAGADTLSVKVDIPAGVTSVRPMPSDFGRVRIEKDNTGTITAVVWERATADVFDADIAYYELTIRLKVPNQPFTTVFFPTHQTCRAGDGTMSSTDWIGLPTDPLVDGGPANEPAPSLSVLPARFSGWNKLTVAQAAPDLAVFFSDAQIVWKGTAAYSINPATQQLIAATSGVTPLTSLAAGDEIWVRY